MTERRLEEIELSDQDLDFLIDTAYPRIVDKPKLKQILREDKAFRETFITDERVFRRLMAEEELFLRISPRFFFEILLRKAASELKGTGYTFEKTGTQKIPIFDTREIVGLLTTEPILLYLADMLASFTRVESYTLSIPLGKGLRERIRFNNLDVFSLKSFCEIVDEEFRFSFYKRIADICLFILGVFPDYARHDYRYPFSGQVRPQIGGKARMSPEEYEKEGRRFYQLAAEHASAKELELSGVFKALNENFEKAKKPLNFITEHYLQMKRQRLFS